MEALPNLICGNFAVGGKDNLPPDNELEKCSRCGELVSTDDITDGLCPSCSAYVDKE